MTMEEERLIPIAQCTRTLDDAACASSMFVVSFQPPSPTSMYTYKLECILEVLGDVVAARIVQLDT